MTSDAARRPVPAPTTDPTGSTVGRALDHSHALTPGLIRAPRRSRGVTVGGLVLSFALVTGALLMAEPAAAADSTADPVVGSVPGTSAQSDPTEPPAPEPTEPDPVTPEPSPDPEPTEPTPDPDPTEPTDPGPTPDPTPVDTDGDGLSDIDEARYGSDPAKPDTDGDGLKDGEEVHRYGTSPTITDTDGDWADDGFEVSVGTDPLDPNSVTRVTAHVRVVKQATATGEGVASASNRVRVQRGVEKHRLVKKVKIRGKRHRIRAVGRAAYFTSGSASTTERVTSTQRGTATVDASCTAPTYKQAYDCASQNATRLATDQAQMTAHENAVRVAQDAAQRAANAIATQKALSAAQRAPVSKVRTEATKTSRVKARQSLRAKIRERRVDHRG